MGEEQSERMFDFEKLEVYQLALDFFDQLCAVCRNLPREVRYPLGDQLVRAALSISNNLAEGTGKQSKKEKARYYGTSIDSARECISMLNVLLRQQHIDRQRYGELRQTGQRITGMLHGLIDSLDRYQKPYSVHRTP